MEVLADDLMFLLTSPEALAVAHVVIIVLLVVLLVKVFIGERR